MLPAGFTYCRKRGPFAAILSGRFAGAAPALLKSTTRNAAALSGPL
jgi:hypothetical protein